jgi:hypothetical protein
MGTLDTFLFVKFSRRLWAPSTLFQSLSFQDVYGHNGLLFSGASAACLDDLIRLLLLNAALSISPSFKSCAKMSFRRSRKKAVRPKIGWWQGCQTFLGTTYQKMKIVPNEHKIYRMAIAFTNWP